MGHFCIPEVFQSSSFAYATVYGFRKGFTVCSVDGAFGSRHCGRRDFADLI
jgi:hypothetical protein